MGRIFVIPFIFKGTVLNLMPFKNATQMFVLHISSLLISQFAGWTNKGPGVRVPVGSKMFNSPYCPDQLWGPSNLL
jgi:hypothetical protein